ncbi:hypothetical protein ACFZ8E_25050 [Methylobacterium sp. HMF5984]|uniref:hypothetical protein n=1 Tax=Methylobacterium sp. HMF5984 TaxID=3367370 RepID=UPI0038536836
MLDDGAGAGDRAGRKRGDGRALRGEGAGRVGAGQVAMKAGKTDAEFAELAQKRLDAVAVARDPEPIRYAEQVIDPLGCLAIRHRGTDHGTELRSRLRGERLSC